MNRDSKPEFGKPSPDGILVPHSDFCGCLCLEVCLHLGRQSIIAYDSEVSLPTSETQMPDPFPLSLGCSAKNILPI